MAEPAPREDKRDAILAAALDLFAERGFHGTTVPSVAKRAKVGAGTIYRYFDSKEALVNAVFQQWKRAVSREVMEAFPPAAPPREQFRAIWQRMAAFALDNPRAFAFLELHHHRSYLDEDSLAIEDQLIEFGAGFVQMAQRAGLLRAGDPTLLMVLAFGAFIGVVRAGWEGKIELTPEVFATAEEATWRAIAT